MVEQIPLALEFADTVMRSPNDHWCEDDSLIREWPVKIITRGVAQEVGISG